MEKTPVYFVPGMAANSKIYERIVLDKNRFELHFLEWSVPLSKQEPIQAYAKRFSQQITHKDPVLIGVSFGGILVQEISKIIPTKKIVIISSIKSKHELSKRFRLIQKMRIYRLFPAKFIKNLEGYTQFFLDDYQQKKLAVYQKYMSFLDPDYLHWAIYTLLHWQQKRPLKKTIHIQGTNDRVFPIKTIKNCIPIKNGTHAMILTKPSSISKEIEKALTC